MLEGDGWRQSHYVFQREHFVGRIIDVNAFFELSEQESKLGMEKSQVDLIVPLVGEG